MNYTLHQLIIFQTVYKHKSITKAAEELHLTQPAVSIQLKKLQDQFDIPLTEIIGRQLYITDFGEKIAEACDRILNEAESIKTTMNQYKGLLVGRLTIATASTGKYVIPYFLNKFVHQHPGVEISIDVTNKSQVVERMVKNDIDFALVSVPPEEMQLEKIDLIPNKLFLVGNTELIESHLPIETPGDLEDKIMIFREKGSATRTVMEEFLARNNVSIKRKMELVSNEAVKQAVHAGLGFSVMPIIGFNDALSSGEVKIIPMKGLPIVTTWSLVYLKNKSMSPVALEFVEFLKENKQHAITKYFDWQKDYN